MENEILKPPAIKVEIAELGAYGDYRFTVIFARYRNRWLYARHKKRETFETAGGHIEPGETPLECAKRELYEETGAVKFSIRPLFDYMTVRGGDGSGGQVFFAEVEALGAIPESEMAEVREFAACPENLTYPDILPVLHEETMRILNGIS